MQKIKRQEKALAAEATNTEDPEKNVNKNPDLVSSKIDFGNIDAQTKANAIVSSEEIETDDELDDLEEDIIVTHL